MAITSTILAVIVLLAAMPTGLLLRRMTRDEKPIYKKYFPVIMWPVAIAAAIFYTLDITIALTLTFIFITILAWSKK